MTFKQGSCCWDSVEHPRRKNLQCKFGATLLKSAEWLLIHCGVSEVQSHYFWWQWKRDLYFPGLNPSWDVPALSVQCHWFQWDCITTTGSNKSLNGFGGHLRTGFDATLSPGFCINSKCCFIRAMIIGIYVRSCSEKRNCKFGYTKNILCSMMPIIVKIPNICH